MVLENRLGIADFLVLACAEEGISKIKAFELFEMSILNTFEVGTFEGLAQLHEDLFGETYDFAGKVYAKI